MTDDRTEDPDMHGEPKGSPEQTRKHVSKLLMPDDWDEALDGEWDDEMASEEALAEGAEIELIVEYLNGHLDPERAEQVRRRLEEDEAFLELASPMLLVWSIPKYIERYPRPPGEWEQAWEDFSRRVGIGKYRPKPKPRWPRFLLLGLGGLVMLVLLAAVLWW
jgi:hypothetical protein